MDTLNPYYKSYFSRKLQEYYDFVPKYTIEYKHNLFFVRINSKSILLNEKDIKLLFFETSFPSIMILSNKKNLANEAYFHIQTRINKEGYLSLFNIDEEGKVITLYSNKLHTKGKYIFPDLDLYDGLQAKVPSNANQSVEFYIAVLCEEVNDFAIFDNVSDKTYNTNDNAVRFNLLYPLLKKCDYASTLIKISK